MAFVFGRDALMHLTRTTSQCFALKFHGWLPPIATLRCVKIIVNRQPIVYAGQSDSPAWSRLPVRAQAAHAELVSQYACVI